MISSALQKNLRTTRTFFCDKRLQIVLLPILRRQPYFISTIHSWLYIIIRIVWIEPSFAWDKITGSGEKTRSSLKIYVEKMTKDHLSRNLFIADLIQTCRFHTTFWSYTIVSDVESKSHMTGLDYMLFWPSHNFKEESPEPRNFIVS